MYYKKCRTIKQHTPMTNPNYLSKCPLMHYQFFHSNKKHVVSCDNWIRTYYTINFERDAKSSKSMVIFESLI